MSSFRIRRDGREYIVEDEKALIRLARAGALLGEDQLKEEPEGLWTDANLHPLLWEIYQADPWAAWDDLDEVEDPEKVWNSLTSPASLAGPARPEAPRVRPPQEDDAETLAPIKARGIPLATSADKPLRPPRRRKTSSVTTGKRWSGPTNPGDPVAPVSGGDLRPGVPVARPAGIKLDDLPEPPEADADSGRIQVKVPGATETRVAPPVDMVVDPGVSRPTPSGEIPLPELNLPQVGPRGQVIAFPAPAVGGGSRGGALPAEKALDDPTLPPRLSEPLRVRPSLPRDEPVRAFRREPVEQKTATFSLLRVVPVVLFFGGFVVALVWWMDYQAQQTFNNIPVMEAPRPPSEDEVGGPASGTVVEVPEEGRVYDMGDDEPELLTELRSQLPIGDQRDVENEEDLEVALLMDLSRLKIHGVSVQAAVVEWGGDEEHPVPDKMTLVVQADSYGEPDRELAAIGLAVGKYITHLDLNLLAFEIQLKGEGGKAWSFRPNPEDAAALYSKEISLEDYLLNK